MKAIHAEMSGFVDKFTWIGCFCVNFLTIKEFCCIGVYKAVNSEVVLEDYSILNSRTCMTCVCSLFSKLEMVIPLSSHYPNGTLPLPPPRKA